MTMPGLAGPDWLPRSDWQFHWHNRGWRDFEEFLASLKPKKRKNIRHERQQVANAGVHCEIRHGDELDAQEWQTVHRLYRATFDAHGNHPALTEGFFRHLGHRLARQVLVVFCHRGGKVIAASLFLRSSTTLYGRYWGADEQIPGLHFEACYYQGIVYCLQQGLNIRTWRQGEHKIARGFRRKRGRSIASSIHAFRSDRRRPAAGSDRIEDGSRGSDSTRSLPARRGNRMIRLPRLAMDRIAFPDVASALTEPNGLLAYGGDLRSERLLAAYALGIFPWYSEGQPLLWWSPDPRLVMDTPNPHVPRRLRRWLKTCSWSIRADRAFAAVVRACAQPRRHDGGTWITQDMFDAYCRLHAQGHAHSIEVWDKEELVGGIYGVAIGRMFFGESMFSRRDHASKVALLALCRGLSVLEFPLLDAQVSSSHLLTLGAYELPRAKFSRQLVGLVARPGIPGSWERLFDAINPRTLGTGSDEPMTPVG